MVLLELGFWAINRKGELAAWNLRPDAGQATSRQGYRRRKRTLTVTRRS